MTILKHLSIGSSDEFMVNNLEDKTHTVGVSLKKLSQGFVMTVLWKQARQEVRQHWFIV